MYTRGFFFQVIAVFIPTGVLTTSLQLTSSQEEYAIENSSATLTCSNTSGALLETRWTNSKFNGDANLFSLNGTCIVTRFLNNSDLFQGLCNGNGTYSVVIKSISRSQNGAQWQCMKGTSTTSSNTIVIHVAVPATSAKLSPLNGGYMKENKSQKVTCRTSACRPDPRIQWYLSYNGTEMYNLTLFSNFTYVNGENGLKSANSTLYLKPNRTMNGFRLHCEVRTLSDKADVKSNYVIMNVTYPPDNYPIIKGNYSVLRVIESDTGTFVCSIDGGNPLAFLRWNCFGKDNATLETEGKTVTSTLKWTALRGYSSCSCQANHLNDWKRITNATVDVQYPPGIPTINVSNIKGETVQCQEKIISIIESESINLTCLSDSKPMPTYQWVNKQSFEIHQGNILNFKNITRKANGTYTCHVQNVMNRSIGNTEEGKNPSKIILDILFPAFIDNIEDKSVVEGSQLEKYCPVINGNPSNSTIVWSRQIDQNHWDNKLFIRNVSRTDDSVYTCSVSTEMFPTIGSYLNIEKRQSFHLNVFFQSEITKFTLNESSSEKTVVINTTDNASLLCIATANPSSNITIENPRGDNIYVVLNSNIASHTLRNVSYVNAGEYTCRGRNNYTRGLSSTSNLILIVKSPPRPASGDVSVEKVATILHVNVTLHFSAWNYLDEPNKTVFSWLKENVSLSDNGSKYSIRTNGLQTNLSIRNTTQLDLGLYRVNVINSAGSYIHNYTLTAKDKPDPPTNLQIVNDSITDKSITLTWSPGFNGGFQQTFVVLYKKLFDTKWLNNSLIDTGNENMNHTLYDLASMQEYEIKMFAKNREGNSTKTNGLKFKTEASPPNQVESKTTDNSNIIAGSVSAVVVIFVAITITGVVFFLRKRQNNKSDGLYQNVPFIGKANSHKPTLHTEVTKRAYSSQTDETTFKGNPSEGKRKISNRKENNSKTDETGVEGLQEVDDVPIILDERTEYCNSKDEIDKIKRITVAELYAYVFGNEDDLEVEYQKLPTGLQKPCTFARRPENIALNRYNGIYPYDSTRVKIPEQPEFFINACYIDGYKRKKAYIASLGPTSKTTSDFKTFWQMIWHERSDLIIMLTNLHELSGMKCEQYWPDEGTEVQYGDVLVTSKTTEVYAEYTVRTFEISKGNHKRSLTHLHYTAWPDKTVPEDVTSLLEFRRRMQDILSTYNGPAVVHCSAGIGRTGTLIALDILIEEGLDVGSVNVFECVKSLRDQRVKMVQTLEQYVYIHKALVNSLSFECETFTRKSIQHHLDIKNDQHYSKLFKQLNMSVETNSATEGKERAKNTKYSIKNRQGTDIPGDRFRVFLQHTDGREGSDYINAVYVNSFKRKDHFITAQSPLANNVTDFISMIYHGDCSCIATMEDLKEPGMAVGAYLPEKNKAITFGNFEVTCSKFEENTTCVIRKMKIKYTGEIYSGEKCFYHFQYTKWMTGNKTPWDVEDFVQFVQTVEEYADELGEDRSRVVVHCLKANERSCLFCALAIIMEKLMVEGSVNILNVVRHLRTRRRSAIVSKEQLKFCFEAASSYAKSNKH